MNGVIQYLNIIDSIVSSNSTLIGKSHPLFLFRGESKQHNAILPKYLRPLNGKGVHADSSYLDDELEIVYQFRDVAYPYVQNIDNNDYRKWREYAQHYGVPTRLLDWSSNPLVALFFASIDHKDKDGRVWMINWQNYHAHTNTVDKDGNALSESNKSANDMINLSAQGNPTLINPLIYKPCYIDNRMSAQQSYFMLWGASKSDLASQINDSTLIKEATYINNTVTGGGNASIKDPTILYYFTIDKKQKQKNIARLNQMGINYSSVFPGLDGIGKYIDMINRYSEQDYIDCLLGN